MCAAQCQTEPAFDELSASVAGWSLPSLSSWVDYLPSENRYAVDRLAAAIFVGDSDPRGRSMAFFTAYLDASGNAQDQPRVVVSGYIASYIHWQLFEKGWNRAHADFGFDRPFHMSEFVCALEYPESYKRQKNARQDYVRIAQAPQKALEFLHALTNLQVLGVLCGISCLIDMQIYEEVSSLLDLRKVVPPYALGARMCLQNVRSWERTFQVSEPVECIFEEGDFEQGKFTQLMIDEGEECPIYKKKLDFAGIEAADMYAWEQTHFLRKYHQNSQIDARHEFKILLHAIPKIHTHAPLEVLINLCHKKGIDPRTGVKK